MDLIRLSIQRPTAVMACVLLLVLFGLLALARIPIQLAPDVRQPIITIDTTWRGASPVDVEREILLRQEDALRGLEGVTSISGQARPGSASITLEFALDRNMDRSLLLVANRLDGIADYPDEVDEPTLSAAGNEDSPIAWFMLRAAAGNQRPIIAYGDFVDDVIKDRLERVPGVARVNVFGGSGREVRVVVDPYRMAGYRLTISEVRAALRDANASATAGYVDEGKRRYVVRAEGSFRSLADVDQVVLRSGQDAVSSRIGRVLVGDIAEVGFDLRDTEMFMRVRGEPAIALNVVRETGANVLEVMDGVRVAVADMARGVLPDAGLTMTQTYDETTYVRSAIRLVTDNIWQGGVLAAAMLLLFLRSASATAVAGLAIPVSIVGTFVAMTALGRTINVMSLAGIAFSVGMLVDSGIVVIENIFRQRERGSDPVTAAEVGTRAVWGAVLGSALTTVAVFVPILAMTDEVGQLFRDIAVAIAVSNVLALVMAATLIPTLAARLLGKGPTPAPIRLPIIDAFADGFAAATMAITRAAIRSRTFAILLVTSLTGATALMTWLFLPGLEYLPEGNRNMVFGSVQAPPGYNLAAVDGIAARIEGEIRPFWGTAGGPTESADGQPLIDNFFIIARPGGSWISATALDPARARELAPILSAPIRREPGTFGFVGQASLFGRNVGGARSIDLDISGPNLDTIFALAGRAMGLVVATLPLADGHQVRPNPGLDLGAPEIRVEPDRVRLADAGVSAGDLAASIDAFNDGLLVTESEFEGERLDVLLGSPGGRVGSTQEIGRLPVVTPSGEVLPVESLARVTVTAGPQIIRREERERTVTLQIRPAAAMPLEEAILRVERDVIAPLREAGLPPGVRLTLSGTADKLARAWSAMQINFLIGVAVVFLVMAILFESFLYPLIIMLSVPLATAGGVAGLAVLNLFVLQPFDMLTQLGFIVLVGTVVNNAVLLVHQTLHHRRNEGMGPEAAILAATYDRLRPIFMSTLTSVAGMLPLVIVPGPGSELYRGLGSVVVGGLSLSAVLTLAVVPPLLGLFLRGATTFP
ncbi:MAG: efflux RND transporter permease subunit [Alphaproteobacteria bacterium]|nr:efflux RND transporter permease subunit [Alphaproteobacteria bacterium]